MTSLCKDGHVLVLTGGFHLNISGVSAQMRGILSQFDPASYTVVTYPITDGDAAEHDPNLNLVYLRGESPFLANRYTNWIWRRISHPFVVRRLVQMARRLRPRVIIGVYPYHHFLDMAAKVACAEKIPWIAYINDIMLEQFDGRHDEKWVADIQSRTFREASSLMAISGGVADYYRRMYGVEAMELPHVYTGPPLKEIPRRTVRRQGFWGGSIYDINIRALGRVSNALASCKCKLVVTTHTSLRNIERSGVPIENLVKEYIPRREDYLRTLEEQGILVVALDWPDESPIADVELETIFPTKTIEYLASGRPIVVHCPEHYFLAKFFLEHQCGLVVAERSEEALRQAIWLLLEGGERVDAMCLNARKTVEKFAAARVARQLKDEVDAVASVSWSKKVRGAK